MNTCKVCHRPIWTPPNTGKVLIIAEEPLPLEINNGIAFLGKEGTVFRKEIARLDIDPDILTVVYLWQHSPSTVPEEIKQRCFDAGYGNCLKYLRTYKYTLMLGSLVAKCFLDDSAGNVSGLWYENPIQPKSYVMAAPDYASQLGGTVGEFRLALERFFGKAVSGCPNPSVPLASLSIPRLKRPSISLYKMPAIRKTTSRKPIKSFKKPSGKKTRSKSSSR